MKNKNQNRLILRMLAVILLISATSYVFGQEYIRGTSSLLSCDTAIIRAVDNGTAFVYNKNVESIIMKVSQSVNPVSIWNIEPYFINDLELADGMVYFCGYKMEDTVKKAIIGRFLISSFGSGSSFQCGVFDECSEFLKMDYYKVGNMSAPVPEGHIVVTGAKGNRVNVLVDWIVTSYYIPSPTPSPFTYACFVYTSNDETIRFDDVAVTDNHVVVSSRRKENTVPVIDYWQFKKTNTVGNSIFTSSFQHLLMVSPAANSPIILEHINSDTYAAVYKNTGFMRMVMLQFSAPGTLLNGLEIYGDENQTLTPIDLKFNKTSSVFDILARNINFRDTLGNRYIGMQIYHVTQNILNGSTSVGNGTMYSNLTQWSIDPTMSSNYFFAAGGDWLLPRLYKYRHDICHSCPEPFEYRAHLGYPEKVNIIDAVTCKRYDLEDNKVEVKPDIIEFPVLCPTDAE